MGKKKSMIISEKDNVAIALENLKEGDIIEVDSSRKKNIKLKNDIKFLHKFALKNIDKGSKVIKYGETIGKATKGIKTGEQVHLHNLSSQRG